MYITPPLCISVEKLWSLIPVEETGAWLVVTENIGVFFPLCGYVFNQLSNKFVFLLKFCPLTSSGLQEDSSSSHPLLPCPSFLPVSRWMSHIFSLPLHKFGSRKEKDHGDLCDSPHSYPFITLWKVSFPCAVCLWSLSKLHFWGRMGQGVFYFHSGELEMLDKEQGASCFSLSSPPVLEMLS